MGEPDDEEGDEARAAALLGVEGDEPSTHEGNVQRCSTCGQRMPDEFSELSESRMLDMLQVELLRDLLRGYRDGTITHQEKAIVRGMLRDSKRFVATDPVEEDEEATDPHLPEPTSVPTVLPGKDASGFEESEGG